MLSSTATTETARQDRATSVHFSSKTDLWETPQQFFDALDAEFGFTLDVCALPHNAKCERYFTPEVNGLTQPWQGVCWMNPPYGREIGRWVRKAFESARAGAIVICLLPSRTDTTWWHTWVLKVDEMRFIRGWLKFGGSQNSAPFPSAVVVFRPSTDGPQEPRYDYMERMGHIGQDHVRADNALQSALESC